MFSMTLHQQEPGAGYDKRAFETLRASAGALTAGRFLATAGKSAHQEGKADLRKEQIRLQSELAVVAMEHTSETHAPFDRKIDALIASIIKSKRSCWPAMASFLGYLVKRQAYFRKRSTTMIRCCSNTHWGATRSFFFVWAVSTTVSCVVYTAGSEQHRAGCKNTAFANQPSGCRPGGDSRPSTRRGRRRSREDSFAACSEGAGIRL